MALQAKDEQVFTIRDNVDLVLLDVTVQTADGSFAPALTQENFLISDDGHPQPITHFAVMDAPVTVGLIVDNSGSMRLKRPDVVMAGLSFAKSSNPQDEFFVINFNDRVYSALPKSVPFTDELGMLRSALFLGTPAGRTALYDAIATGLQHLAAGHRESKALVVVSDGGDNASQLRLPELMQLLTESRASVYAVALLDPEDRDLNPRVLRRISSLSGGEFFAPKSLEDLLPIFSQISGQLRHRYTLGFVPSAHRPTSRVHNLRVRVHDGRGTRYRVRSRTSYTTAAPSKS